MKSFDPDHTWEGAKKRKQKEEAEEIWERLKHGPPKVFTAEDELSAILSEEIKKQVDAEIIKTLKGIKISDFKD